MEHLETSKINLRRYFLKNYATTDTSRQSSQSSDVTQKVPPRVSFTSRYQKKDRVAVDELADYFKLPLEDFETCDPLEWWKGRRSQFPNLYRLVCDIFSIPGMLLYLLFSFKYN